MPQINKTAASPASPATPRTARPSEWSANRIALTAFFALDGLVFAGWVVRIPAVKAAVHASSADLGLALLCVSIGAIVTMGPVGRLVLRYGTARVTLAGAVTMCGSVALPPQVHTVLGLSAALLLFGAGFGTMNVALNSAAVDLVAVIRRPVMPTFHAAYSLGGLIGAALGGLLTRSLTAAQHLGLMAAFGLLVTAVAGPVLLRTHPVPVKAPAPDDAAPAPADGRLPAVTGTFVLVLLLGLVALCDAYGEGALADWGTLHLTADLHTSPSVAAAGFAAYSLAMTTGRFSGTRLVERFGTTRVMVGGSGLAAVGMLAGALSTSLPLVLGGFLLVGLGLSNIFPLAIDRAGALDGPKGVATASMLGYGGMVLGPPLIGFLAQGIGLPHALLSVALLAVLSGCCTLAVRRAAAGAIDS